MPAKRIAIVTGGNRGLGREIARQLMKAEVFVVVGCRDKAKCDAALEALRAQGPNVDAFPLEELESFEAHHIRVGAEVRRLRREAEGETEAVLAALEADLHTHLHEEHNVLFPRALAALGRAYA